MGLFNRKKKNSNPQEREADRLIIQELLKAGTDTRVPHLLRYSFQGTEENLNSLFPELYRQGFRLDQKKEEEWIVRRMLPWKPELFHEISGELESLAAQYQCLYIGWVTEPIKKSGQALDGDCQNGYGTFVSFEGGRYEGDWKESKREGLGLQSYPNGDEYFGLFHEDMRHGKGTFIFNDGEFYQGEWQEDQFHGKGVFQFNSGIRINGTYSKHQLNGPGVKYYPNGDRWEGTFEADKEEGQGKYILASGKVVSGVWHKGVFDESTRKGTGADLT